MPCTTSVLQVRRSFYTTNGKTARQTFLMSSRRCNRPAYSFAALWQWLYLLVIIVPIGSQTTANTRFVLSNPGTEFVPEGMPSQLLTTMLAKSMTRCAISCASNAFCRVFDYEASATQQCRLFEADIDTLGRIDASSSVRSRVGALQLTPSLFLDFGQPCTATCDDRRYLRCGSNSTCECAPHTYWNASISMCVAQSSVLGAPCQQNRSMCREDLNLTCLPFNQCGRKLDHFMSNDSVTSFS